MADLPLGIDVSSHQGVMDFGVLAKREPKISFMAARFGWHDDFVDPRFERNWAGMRDLGVGRIAYWGPDFLGDSMDQASYIVNALRAKGFNAEHDRLAIDAELNQGAGKALITMFLDLFSREVQRLTGQWPILYSRANWLDLYTDLSQIPTEVPLWLAQYRWRLPAPLFTPEYDSTKLTLPKGRGDWLIHQTSERGNGRSFGAASYYIDLDRWNGTEADVRAFFGYGEETLPILEDVDLALYKARVITSPGYRLIVRRTAGGPEVRRLESGDVISVYQEAGGWARIGVGEWVSMEWIQRIYDVNLPIVVGPTEDSLQLEVFGQRDPRWSWVRLGTGMATIGQEGCLLCCVAMVSRYFGFQTDPARLNQALIKVNGFEQGNLFKWWSLEKIYPLKLNTWIECATVPAPLHEIDAALARKEPVLVWVDFNPATAWNDMHWVVITGKLPGGDYRIADPWTGRLESLKARYSDPARFIFRIVTYKKTGE